MADKGDWLGSVATLWIAASTFATAIFAWLGWRIARRTFLLNVPYVGHVTLEKFEPRLWGEGADRWEIGHVRLLKPRKAYFVVEPKQSPSGEVVGYTGPPAGRSLDGPLPWCAIVGAGEAAKVAVTIRLKSDPKIDKRRVITINRAA